MLSGGDLTDDEWAVLEPLLPVSNNRCGRWRDHRQVINGIIHRLSTGVQRRELPERFGPWQTVHKRHAPWSADGTWERLLQHVQAVADAAGDIDWDVNVDSTSVRAHQHAAGAPKNPPPVPPRSSKGAPRRSVHVHAHLTLRLLLEEAVRQAKPSAAPAGDRLPRSILSRRAVAAPQDPLLPPQARYPARDP
ncbi:IS5 family transposase [Streptomyces sp. S186]|uniref:IS5 family transposase n=1 Tax=Streptomyces sp. S186 TaxID=3434395 RepID=UPI003F666CE8